MSVLDMKDITKAAMDCAAKKSGLAENQEQMEQLDVIKQAEFLKAYAECFFDELRKSSKDDFDKWMAKAFSTKGKELDATFQRLMSYYTKIGVPLDTLQPMLQLLMVTRAVGLGREYIWDQDIAPKYLGLTLLQSASYLQSRLELQHFHDLRNLANNHLGLDSSWMVSAIALSLEELLIRKKLKELQIEIGEREKFHILCEKLVKALKKKDIRPTCEVLKTKGRREVRNHIFHEGDNPDEDEAYRLMGEVIKLIQDLWPKKEEQSK